MSHTLTLEISDNVYASLIQTAEQTGQVPEKMAAQWLAAAIQHLHNDPLESFIGTFKSNVSDWADNHDQYLRERIIRNTKKLKESDE